MCLTQSAVQNFKIELLLCKDWKSGEKQSVYNKIKSEASTYRAEEDFNNKTRGVYDYTGK